MAAPTVANTPSASYLEQDVGGAATANFGGSTHTSSNGANRCLVAVITARSNSTAQRVLNTLTWNGVSMSKAVEQSHTDSQGVTATICTINDPEAGVTGALLATYDGNISGAQIRFYNVEGAPVGAASAFATDVDDGAGGTAVDISIAPTVTDTLCIMAVAGQSTVNTVTFSPLTENDDRIHASVAFYSAVASGTLAASGAQSIQATISAVDQFSAVAITLSGAASAGTVGAGLTNSVLLNRRSLVG